MQLALTIAALAIVVATALPLLRRDEWWIRVFDFPRLQIAAIGALVLVALLWFAPPRAILGWGVVALLVAALVYQGSKIIFYTPLVPKQAQGAGTDSGQRSVSLLVANVLMDNRDSQRLLAIVREADPDLVLALEPDAWWEGELRVLEENYPYRVEEPRDNRYGMLLYSKLELVEPEIKHLIKDDIPSIHTAVRLASGELVRLHCLHPEPPSPTEADESTERDAELLVVGRAVKERRQPVIVAGDLNDVAWSYTTTLFQKVSGLVDPRIGRGMFNSFHAQNPLLRWPLDHVFHSPDFTLVSMARSPAFGSDHFAVMIKLQLEGRGRVHSEIPDPPDATDEARAEEKIAEAKSRQAL